MGVEARPRELLEYVTESGRCPFGEWLNGLRDVQARALIRKRLNRVRLGNLGDSKNLGEGVKEMRMDFGPGYRIYFGDDGAKLVILLCGGDKGSQVADIRQAKEYWADYARTNHAQKNT